MTQNFSYSFIQDSSLVLEFRAEERNCDSQSTKTETADKYVLEITIAIWKTVKVIMLTAMRGMSVYKYSSSRANQPVLLKSFLFYASVLLQVY